MPSKYIVQAQREANRYSIWDVQAGMVAKAPDGTEYRDLPFVDAFAVLDKLNKQPTQNSSSP